MGVRYLGLTGVIIRRDLNRALADDLEQLKRTHFNIDPDEGPLFLHRTELIEAKGRFSRLTDSKRRTAFDADLFALLEGTAYRVITVVVDKRSHKEKEYRAIKQPYHYGLHALLERYCGWLRYIRSNGDVMSESRGKAEDKQLAKAYRDFYEKGSNYFTPADAQAVLTSKELKLKKKEANVPGLQLADLLAHPSTRDVLVHAGNLKDRGGPFAERICRHLENRYNRREDQNRIHGYGRILLL